MFKYDPKKVPDVKLEREWPLEDGTINQVYRAGDWSFDSTEEADLDYVMGGIYAFIAWYDFLSASSDNNPV